MLVLSFHCPANLTCLYLDKKIKELGMDYYSWVLYKVLYPRNGFEKKKKGISPLSRAFAEFGFQAPTT